MKTPSVKSVRCAIYTRTADSQITTSSGRWARDIAYATPSRTMMVIAVAPHAARYATAAFLFGEPDVHRFEARDRSPAPFVLVLQICTAYPHFHTIPQQRIMLEA